MVSRMMPVRVTPSSVETNLNSLLFVFNIYVNAIVASNALFFGAWYRFFTSLLLLLLSFHSTNSSMTALISVTLLDEAGRIISISVTKPTREGYLWNGVSPDIRVRTKPIVDTVSNRWGGGVVAAGVWLLGKSLGGGDAGLVLLLITSSWWFLTGSDLVRVREAIDWEIEEVKKRERIQRKERILQVVSEERRAEQEQQCSE